MKNRQANKQLVNKSELERGGGILEYRHVIHKRIHWKPSKAHLEQNKQPIANFFSKLPSGYRGNWVALSVREKANSQFRKSICS